MIVLVMGVCGCGKTTAGKALADRLDARFLEGDTFHPAANRHKMASGRPLDDNDRWPWLDAIGREAARLDAAGQSAVIACSALRKAYRDRLRSYVPALTIVHLDAEVSVLQSRMQTRKNHFMPPSLLDSQLQTLEPPEPGEGAIRVDSALPLDLLVDNTGLAERR